MNERPEAARSYVASLTGLRGLAAMFVFLFHYGMFNPGIRLDLSIPVIGKALQFPLGLGFAGVDLFFVLSGFLLALPFAAATLRAEPHPPLKKYYRRRLLRVFPAYYAQFAIILAAGAWFLSWRQLDGVSFLAHLGMVFNLGWTPVRPMVGVWWTLPIELSFYLLLPLIASFMRPLRWLWVLIPGVAMSMVYRLWAADHFAAESGEALVLAASHLPGSLPLFLAGSSAAVLVQVFRYRGTAPPPRWILDLMLVAGAMLSACWLWGIVLANGTIYWRGHWSMIIGPFALGLSLTLMVVSLYWGSRLGALLLANRVVYFLGLISYSIYLWHFPVLQQLQEYGGDVYAGLQGFPRFLVTTLAVVAVSAVSYFLFERPFFRLRGKRAKTG